MFQAQNTLRSLYVVMQAMHYLNVNHISSSPTGNPEPRKATTQVTVMIMDSPWAQNIIEFLSNT